MLSDRFKLWFDRVGLLAGVASIGFGFWDRASGRNANGSYFVVLGAVALAIAFVSFLKRARRT